MPAHRGPSSAGDMFFALTKSYVGRAKRRAKKVRFRSALTIAVTLQWLAYCGIRTLRPLANTMLAEISKVGLPRVEAVERTLQFAWQHERFRELAQEASMLSNQKKFASAETLYDQALQLFPLHSGYRVQLAHSQKEQQRYLEAFNNYCFALSVGAPPHDVVEHLVYAARNADISVNEIDIERLVSAWTAAQQIHDDWAAPPIEADFHAFARLLWGNTGLITPSLIARFVLKCTTRKQLFMSLLQADETLHYNARLFILLKEQGLADV